MQTLQAGANPEMAQQVLDRALADIQPSTSELPPTPVPPNDSLVELPFGYLDPGSGMHREAEVRELNGVDEEALARIPPNSFGRLLNTILERGVVRIGGLTATPDILDTLLAADRDSLLLAIRRATYGQHVELFITCSSCTERTELSIDLDDIPVKLPEDRNERVLTLQLRTGEAIVALPTGKVLKEIANAGDKTNAELNTLLISGCLRSLNGISLAGPSQARGLSVRDRRSILAALTERMWGPQLTDVPVACAACGKETSLDLSMGDLFRL